MEINSVNNINFDDFQSQPSLASQDKQAEKILADRADITNTDYQNLVEKALAEQENAERVEQAKAELEAGTLDDILNIRNAAENIFNFGI